MAQRLAAGPEGISASGTRGDALLRHRDDVHAVVRRVVADRGLAEDVVQETLARALRHEDTVEPERAGAWLTVVGRRLAVDTFRTRQRFDVVAEHDERPSAAGDPAELAERRHLLAQVAEAFDELSPRQRRLLLRQLDSGLSLAQLAEEERTTVASVRSVLARAREVLRANLHHTGWLVAGLLPRLLTTVRSPATRLLSRIETAMPVVPQARGDLAEVAAAGAAAVALLLSALGGPGSTGHDRGEARLPSPVESGRSVGGFAASPEEVPSDVDALGLDLVFHELEGAGEDDLSDISWWEMPPEREHIEIPFQDFGGDVTHFAVSPDDKTVIAIGGWVETAASANGTYPLKEWTPLFYRSDDGGHSWQRREVPGFVPGRILFAPQWPADQRMFVVTETKSVLQSDDGGRTFTAIEQVGSTRAPEPPPPDPDHPERTLTWAEQQQPDTSEDPETTIRKQQLAPPTPPVRPALLARTDHDLLIYIGGEGAGVFHVKTGAFEPFAALAPWHLTNGVALAPDHADTGAVLVGAVPHNPPNGSARGGVYNCAPLKPCSLVEEFPHMGNAPGVFVSGDVVYAWTPYTAYRSADGGATWARQVLGPVLDIIEVDRRFIAISMSGVPVSDDRGATWRHLPMVYSMWAAAAVGYEHVLVASGPGVACSPDEGEHWLPNCPPN